MVRPKLLLTLIWLFSVTGIVLGLSLETLASYAALGALMILIPIQIASMRLPKLFPDQYRRSELSIKGFWLWFCPVVGILMVVFFSFLILYDLNITRGGGRFFGGYHIRRGLLFTQKKIYSVQLAGNAEDLRENATKWEICKILRADFVQGIS